VLLREAANAVAVPRSAVRLEGEERTPVVYVIAGGKVSRRAVALGITDEEQWLVQLTSGVQLGEVVVVGPAEGLANGAPAEVLKATSGAAAPGR
jgi:hypothetical protein